MKLSKYLKTGLIHHVTIGGESGSGARICKYEWVKKIVDDCKKYNVDYWFKQTGATDDQRELFNNLPEQDRFLEAMADAASSVVNYFKGNAAYINVMKNISVDCDCDCNAKAPCMKDIGILASTDPIAVDQACLDLVYNSDDPGRDELIERIESRHGVHTIEAASKLGFGSRDYELINI